LCRMLPFVVCSQVCYFSSPSLGVFSYFVILSGTFSKYVHINQKMDWRRAQIYCQQHYTDLAPVSNKRDNNELQQLASNVNDIIWIGLVRNSSDRTEWLWSGGGAPTMYFWAQGEPNDYYNREDYASTTITSTHPVPLLCHIKHLSTLKKYQLKKKKKKLCIVLVYYSHLITAK
uniref:C-type lectin domain-containing protein n=1 Tax=Neolamprologus brichardi TaxID=32507 RepID=A0A3Q4HNZ5_NEOBR